MKNFLLLLGVLGLFLSLNYVQASDDVIVLTDETFPDALVEHDNIMVEFYAPWCGHCKQLAPAYAQVATSLKGEVAVAKVDCTTEKETCNSQGVRGFPTLKLFQNGKPIDFNGPERSASAITSFIRRYTGPAATEVTSKNADLFPTLADVVVLGAFDDAESDAAKIFLIVANQLRTEYTFGVTTDAAVKAKYSVSGDSILLLAKFNDGPVVFTGDMNAADIVTFIETESFPIVAEIGPENYQKYVERKLPIFWTFVSAADFPVSAGELTAPIEAVKSAAENFKGVVSAVYLDGEKYVRHRNQLGHNEPLPGAILDDSENHKKYKFSGAITSAAVESFLQSFVDGTLEPFIKSEEIPSEEEQAASPVKVIVAKTFDSIVNDESKNVLVEFYAPWCGHCKNLAPTYESLAKQFSSVEDLVIAKVDATANDVPERIEGFPTLIMYPKGGASPVKYEGDRSFDDLKSFLQTYVPESENAVHDEL
eukprot:TRINITY_DN10792_c0_g1_i1.p1 TRINITY_DN10792_c0_g1~~TRINITY_DN10792_c0_g1_i1.p1  ORF type:complete len:480 (-),score=169.75 TRINITY_DN10792_c0_g1_i1:63-1502(-)